MVMSMLSILMSHIHAVEIVYPKYLSCKVHTEILKNIIFKSNCADIEVPLSIMESVAVRREKDLPDRLCYLCV